MLDRAELESALKCKGDCYECKMPIPDEEFSCEHLLAQTAIAQQQENEQLKDENASIRNWNACEEKLHNELLESDKRRWELESELEDANNYRAGLEAIVDKLRAHVARMRDALQYYADVKRWGTVNLQYVPTPEVAKKALAEIDKAIGGKEDA